mgnify:CR=1 FL=1
MASAKDIRRRIRTVRNIQQMTQAMKLVASARFQQAQQRVIAARPYADKVRQLMTGLAAAGGSFEHPLLQVRPEERVTAIVIGADKGLAGSYHANLVRLAQRFLEGQQGEPRVYVMGKKALGSIRRLEIFSHSVPPSQPSSRASSRSAITLRTDCTERT